MIPLVGTAATTLLLRQQSASLRLALQNATTEVSTGRRADVGASLGGALARNVSARVQVASLAALGAQDDVAGARLDAIATTMTSLRSGVQSLRDQLTLATQSPQARSGLVDSARVFLNQYAAAMGQTLGGVALFGGQSLDGSPLAPYDPSSASGPAAAIAAAFQGAFGMAPDDPAVANISAADMSAFLDGAYAGQFDAAQWSTNWSSATDAALSTRIAPGESVATNVSANEDGLRAMAQFAVALCGLGAAKLNEGAFGALASKAQTLADAAVSGSQAIETNVGASRARVTAAQSAMKATQDLLKTQVSASEDVDPADAAIRVNNLTTQLEASYAVTARLKNLSLLNYL